MSLYDILELPTTATSTDIRRAYKRLAKRYHPDRRGGDPNRFQRLYHAYTVLMDPHQRRHYDKLTYSIPKWFHLVLVVIMYLIRRRRDFFY